MSPPIRPAVLIVGFLMAVVACGLPALAQAVRQADDCTAVRTGMLTAARIPHTLTLTRIQQGKPVTSRMVQTTDTRYVEVSGKWHSIPFTAEDVHEMETRLNQSQLTCARVGKDSIDGKEVTVYVAHIRNSETDGDSRLWLGADGLPVKVDNVRDGELFSSTYDFAHAEPPADATPLEMH